MKCFNPRWLKVTLPSGQQSKIQAPCGKCAACLYNRSVEWQIRLNEEFKKCETAYFVTLTYSDDNLPFQEFVDEETGDVFSMPVVSVDDYQKFIKRLRFDIRPFKIRYFLVSEYGPENLRPHYHMILFNFPKELDIVSHIEKTWGKGFITVSPVTRGRIAYVTKYVTGFMDLPEYLPRPFMRCSRRPAIGACYLTPEIIKYHLRDLYYSRFVGFNQLKFEEYGFSYPINYYQENGYKKSLPRYYKKKLYTDDREREFLFWKNHAEQLAAFSRFEREVHSEYYDYIARFGSGVGFIPKYIQQNNQFAYTVAKRYKKGRKL